MQARIQQARREAETLKDRIKRKKDELADTTCTCLCNWAYQQRANTPFASCSIY